MKRQPYLLYDQDTEFGRITVDKDYSLRIDGKYQSGLGSKKYEHRKAEHITAKSICVVGLGCGFAVEALVNKGIDVVVIERSKEVIELAKGMFKFSSKCKIINESYNGTRYGQQIVLDHRFI